MRNLRLLDKYRMTDKRTRAYFGDIGDDTCGCFSVPSPIDGGEMHIIASAGAGWEHVSVSRKNRCPNWPEMSHVKGLFFRNDETVVQFHVPESDHINEHHNCLHLWRPMKADLPRPPGWMVGGEQPSDAELAEAGL